MDTIKIKSTTYFLYETLCGKHAENAALPSWKLANGLLMKNMKILNLLQYASRFCFPQWERLEKMDLHILLKGTFRLLFKTQISITSNIVIIYLLLDGELSDNDNWTQSSFLEILLKLLILDRRKSNMINSNIPADRESHIIVHVITFFVWTGFICDFTHKNIFLSRT